MQHRRLCMHDTLRSQHSRSACQAVCYDHQVECHGDHGVSQHCAKLASTRSRLPGGCLTVTTCGRYQD